MSDSPERQSQAAVRARSLWGGCLNALMALAGIILLLPGFCVLAYAQNWEVNWLMVLILALAAAGVAMFWVATRNFRR